METGLIVVLVIVAILVIWYIFMRKDRQKCATAADCPTGQTCSSGYCKKTTGS